MKRLLNVSEAAEYLGLKKQTLYKWVCSKKIAYVKAGRRTMFDIADLNTFIELNRVEPALLKERM
jgi:excisionase family DNA binding protein